MNASQDMVAVLEQDHREVEELFQKIQAVPDAQRRKELADQMTAELVRHSVAEEQYLYPTTREALPDGDDIADHEIEEHAEVEEALKRLEGLSGDDPEFMRVFTQVRDSVTHHVQEEEGDLFPRLREAVPAERMRELGDKIEKAKRLAPTRPHPSAPDTPPLNKILGPGMGLVDRLRDKLTGRSTG